MSTKPKLIKGWGFPYLAKKAHYYNQGDSTSLCGKWMYTGERVDSMHDHKDNCVSCMKKRNAQEEKQEAA